MERQALGWPTADMGQTAYCQWYKRTSRGHEQRPGPQIDRMVHINERLVVETESHYRCAVDSGTGAWVWPSSERRLLFI